MMKFELCYQLEGEKTLIAAQLLKRTKPFYDWDSKDNLTIKLSYEFLPKGIITRFIVRLHYHITNQKNVWREGVVLERQNALAEVIETYGKKEIRIRVRGKYKKELLAIVLDNFDNIHKSFPSLKVTKLIPCNCKECRNNQEPNFFEYDLLREYFDENIEEERCRKSKFMVKIAPLLAEAFGKYNEEEGRTPILYISYSDEDLMDKRILERHLKALEKSDKIKIFDKEKIAPGLDEKREQREQLDEAEVILLLISSNFIANERNYSLEMVKALERSENKSCITIPVIIKDCNWEDLPFAKIKPVLYNKKPLFSKEFQIDESLTNAVHQIQISIKHFMSNKKLKKEKENIAKDTIL